MVQRHGFANNGLASISDRYDKTLTLTLSKEVIRQTKTDTYNQPNTIAIAGAPVTMHSVLQSLIRYATPAKAIRESVQQYHREVPIMLRCRVPTSSVRSTKKDIEPPAWDREMK